MIAEYDGEGTLIKEYTYSNNIDEVLSTSSPTPLASSLITYTGRWLEEETGDYFYRARFYDAAVGRFLSLDPIGLESGDYNFYRYVKNTPTIYLDPFGNYEVAPQTEGHPQCTSPEFFVDGDRGFTRNPLFPWNTYKHFRNKQKAIKNMMIAIKKCNKKKFKYALHDFQDTTPHYDKGYRWFLGGHAADSLGLDISFGGYNNNNTVTLLKIKRKTPINVDKFDPINNINDLRMQIESNMWENRFKKNYCEKS